jgi:2-methylcitrate dehydratase PrpD
VELPRQLLVGQGVAGAAAVDLDAGLEFLARAVVTRRTAGKACGNDALQRSSSTQRTRAARARRRGSRAAASVKSSELPHVVFKPYPCNHFTHAGVDAALRLRAQGLAPADVTAIELGVAKPVLRTIAEPPEAKARPASGYHAVFSGP